uniref:helix-turn-helix transcriptional regulator n=1 Tax=Mitsuokella multacida TaxID=52226 RepID=UPI004029C81B
MNNFKVARKEKEYSQEAVARMLGVTTQAYGRYENGQRECSYSTLLQLSTIFGCTIDYLLGNSPAQPASAPTLTTAEAAALRKYRQLTPAGRSHLDTYLDFLLIQESASAVKRKTAT